MKNSIISTVLLTGTMLFPITAFGQETNEEAVAQGNFDTIIVTAQRRAENLQEVPISIEVQTGESLAAANINNLQALPALVPSLSFNAIQAYALPRIRGVGTSTAGPGIESDVAVYVDNVYYASPTGALFSFNNVEQVSVLKGPQGTLFGRNSTAGLVQITTRDPSRGAEFNGSIGYGNYDTVVGNLYVGGPVSDVVAADFAFTSTFQGDGYGRNLTLDRDTRRTRSDINFRSKLVFDPAEGTRFTLIGDYSDNDGSQGTIRVEPGSMPNPAVGPNYGGSVWDVAADVEGFNNVETYGGSLTVEQELGEVTLTSITAYRELTYENAIDLDATGTPTQAIDRIQEDSQFSQELQLQSSGSGPFNWTLGAYYFDGTAATLPLNLRFLGNAIPPNGLNLIEVFARQDTKSYAGYVQASWDIGPGTTLTAGLRYTNEERRGRTSQTLNFTDGSSVEVPESDRKVEFDKVTYRIAADHELNPDVMVYASYNRGFKSGGFNVGAYNAPIFEPAVLDAFEVGAKSDLGNRTRLNVAAFYYDYSNVQVQKIQPNGTLGIINGPSAELYGLEIEMNAEVVAGLRLNAAVNLLDSKFKDFPDAPIGSPNGGVPVTSGDVSGNDLPLAPNLVATLGLDYTHALRSGAELSFNANANYNSGWFTEPDNFVEQNDFVRVGGRIRYTTSSGRYYASLWGANLTNAKARGNAITLVSGTQVAAFDPPRTYGVTLGFNF